MLPPRDKAEALALLEKLRLYLEKRYGVRITGLIRLDRGVYQVKMEGGRSWVARVFSAERGVERAQGDAEVLRFLEEQDFPAEKCARPDAVSNPGGRSVIITEFIEGAKPDWSEATLRSFGEMLGLLNTLPAGSGGVARRAGALHHYSPHEGLPRNEIDAAASWLEEVKDKVPSKNRAAYESLREKIAAADDSHGLPEALIHPDPVPKNVIASPGGLTLIDWTGAGRGARLGPLAVAIWSSAPGKEGWSLDRVDPVVAGYRSRVQLQEDELARLPDVMRVRPLIFACWRYRHAVLSGKELNGKEWWMPSDELVDSISGRARTAFERPTGKI